MHEENEQIDKLSYFCRFIESLDFGEHVNVYINHRPGVFESQRIHRTTVVSLKLCCPSYEHSMHSSVFKQEWNSKEELLRHWVYNREDLM